MVEAQIMLEILFNKNQLLPRLREEFTNAEGCIPHLKKEGIPIKFGIELLVQMSLHKRCNVETLTGVLRHLEPDMVRMSALLTRCVEADLVDFNEDTHTFITRFGVAPEVQKELDAYMYPLPMLIEPRKLNNNSDCAYLDQLDHSVILKDNHHEDDVCLDHLNGMNKVSLSINVPVLNTIQNKWKGIDKRKEGETHDDFKKRKKAFEKYDRTTRDVINIFLKNGNKFYLTHKYDARGRTYSCGYAINYQGNDWNKACIEFTNKELPTS